MLYGSFALRKSHYKKEGLFCKTKTSYRYSVPIIMIERNRIKDNKTIFQVNKKGILAFITRMPFFKASL